MRHSIAAIPGDGIGKEVVPAAQEVLETAASRHGVELRWESFPWGCEAYLREDLMMPPDGLERLRSHDAILLGAVGSPGVPDHVSLWGLLIPIRRGFSQYVNVRPVRFLRGVESPLKGRESGEVDYLIVRENTEGEYSQIGGRLYQGQPEELVVQETVFTRRGVDRVLRYAFELAKARPKRHVTSATKSNGIIHTMPFWDERFAAMGGEYPTVRQDQYHIDILCAHLVQHPDWFDVIVASNLFGDILSDSGQLPPAASVSPRRQASIPNESTPPCLSRYTGPPRTSPARASPIPSGRSGPEP